MDEYLTITEHATGEIVVDRSRFIANMEHVETEEEAVAFISRMRAKYFDARHNVYAIRLANGFARSSDDGEPHSTAGKPIMDVISGAQLFNVAIVVTRYFGGILLGTGGLVRAYSSAASAAISSAKLLKMTECDKFSVVCSYSGYEPLCNFLNANGVRVDNCEFTDIVTVYFTTIASESEKILVLLEEHFFGRLLPKHILREFAPF